MVLLTLAVTSIASNDHKEAMYAIVCGRSGPW